MSLAFAGLAGGCSSKKVVVAEQCPSPYSSAASVDYGGADASARGVQIGTTCAPCDDGERPKFDAKGCPKYVTVESCGGDVCIGRLRVERWPTDAGASDAAVEADAGAGGDGGA